MAVVKISTKYGTDPITVDPGDVAPAYDLSATGSGAFKYGQLMFRHYKIAPTVAANDLIVNIQHLDGSNASATRPLYFMINGTLRSVTAALSVTCADGTNWFNSGSSELATKEVDYFAYIGYNATDGVTLGISRIPFARQYNDFSATSTNEKYARISDITTAAATDPYFVIGRFAATLSAGAGYTWTVPTYTPSNLIQHPVYKTRLLDYGPTWTVITTGNGTSAGKYEINGNSICVEPLFTFGSTSSMGSGAPTCTLPFSRGTYSQSPTNIDAQFEDNGTTIDGAFITIGTTTLTFFAVYTAGSYFTRATLSSTIPFTWTTSDKLYASTKYRIN